MLDIIFSTLGFFIGVFSLAYLFITLHKGPEALRGSIEQLIMGVGIIVVAFIWDLIIDLFRVDILDLHHLFMAIGIIFFANAARKLYKFGR